MNPNGAAQVRRRNAHRMARSIGVALVLALAFAGVSSFGCGRGKGKSPKSEQGAAAYYCPMHPTYTSPVPGDCPICNMRLVPIERGDTTSHASSPTMDPSDAHAPAHGGGHASGYAPVRISVQRRQLIGVRLEPAARGRATKTIRALGKVTYDETRLHHVHTKVEGWIGKLYVSSTGQAVHEGQPLFTLYSPELVATQKEYLLARDAMRRGALGADTGKELLASSERRLLLWDVHPSEIEAIAAAGEPKTHLDISAHVHGVVVEKTALEGMQVMPGQDLYLVADLSTIWVNAAIYEQDLPLVRVGQTAFLTFETGDRRIEGQIAYIAPYLDEGTRTVEARLVFANADGALKPGMFATVEIAVDLGEVTTIPSTGVFDTGERRIVFVAKEENLFEPREVHTGSSFDDRVVVLDGLAPGEEVVVGAQFLIDSESQLRAALEGMARTP